MVHEPLNTLVSHRGRVEKCVRQASTQAAAWLLEEAGAFASLNAFRRIHSGVALQRVENATQIVFQGATSHRMDRCVLPQEVDS